MAKKDGLPPKAAGSGHVVAVQLELFAMAKQCAVEGCPSTGRIIAGLCGKHYQRLKKHGSVNPPGVQFRDHSVKSCQWQGCGQPVKALGLCARHYQRQSKYGDPSATKFHDVDLNAPRLCRHCGKDISHNRTNAVFCNRTCKIAASHKRRLLDGREQRRNLVRYPRERRKRKKQARALYWATHERQLETSSAWRRANPDKRYAQHVNRRGLKFKNPGYVRITDGEWKSMVQRNGYRCTYCGDRPDQLVMDHIIPLSRGGRHAPGNVTPACPRCNSQKAAMFVIEWKRQQMETASTASVAPRVTDTTPAGDRRVGTGSLPPGHVLSRHRVAEPVAVPGRALPLSDVG